MVVHVAVFSARRECKTVRREIHGVHGTEVAMNLGQLLIKDYALEAHLEAASALVSQRHISRVLPAALQQVELLPLGRVKQGTHCDAAARFTAEVVFANQEAAIP